MRILYLVIRFSATDCVHSIINRQRVLRHYSLHVQPVTIEELSGIDVDYYDELEEEERRRAEALSKSVNGVIKGNFTNYG